MSDDLVKRARDDAFLSRATKAAHEVPRAELVEALADEIERLQAEAEGAAAIIMTERAEVMRLRAESARLKEALVEAMIVPEAFMLSGRPAHMRDDVWEQIQRSVTIARAVIQTKGSTRLEALIAREQNKGGE